MVAPAAPTACANGTWTYSKRALMENSIIRAFLIEEQKIVKKVLKNAPKA